MQTPTTDVTEAVERAIATGERAEHPDAKEVGEDYGSLADGGSRVRYECPHCGLRFWVQLPD